jgi:LL-diaminopimelate aminotransferase
MAGTKPRATLYFWVEIPEETLRTAAIGVGGTPHTGVSETFARSLLQETGVALAPGSFFGPAGEGFIRISITAPTDRVGEAMERFSGFICR